MVETTEANLRSSKGSEYINLTVVDFFNVEKASYILVMLSINGADWPSVELLDSSQDLTSEVNDHKIVLCQLAISVADVIELRHKIKAWIDFQKLFDFGVTTSNFQKMHMSLEIKSDKISDANHPYFVLRYEGNKLVNMNYEMKVDQSCLNEFYEGLCGIVTN